MEALLDIGARKSALGPRRARRIAKAAVPNLQLIPSNRRFQFGVNTNSIVG